ncbi:hypothetical protein HDU98_011443 [Podochytrium sp. JEL0797]|nr:hypothetical protein HDU98_011443 [Podochytrium sp. JEL0797]
MSEPMFPRPKLQPNEPRYNFHHPPLPEYVSPIDRDTDRLKRELKEWTQDIHILECKGQAKSAAFSRESLKFRCPTLFADGAKFLQKAVLASVHYERELVTLSDGGTISLDWYPKLPATESRSHDPTPILFLLHGLNGSSNESYIRTLTTLTNQTRNYRVVSMNWRGCGNTLLTGEKPKIFDGMGGGEDVLAVLSHIRKVRSERAKIVAVGWSLGATMILNYLIESKTPLLAGAIALSPTFDLSQSIDLCSLQTGGLYSTTFALGLQTYLYTNWNAIRDMYDIHQTFQPADLRALADCLVEKMRAPEDAATWNMDATEAVLQKVAARVKTRIGGIQVPLLILSSRDDPITKPEWAPLGEICRNANIVFVTTAEGGHCGWFEGTRAQSWANRVALEWIDFVLLN